MDSLVILEDSITLPKNVHNIPYTHFICAIQKAKNLFSEFEVDLLTLGKLPIFITAAA